MRKNILSILMAFLILISINCANAQETLDQKTLYEMSRQCGKQSEERFKNCHDCKDYVMDAEHVATRDYTSHFNRKLNICFMLENIHGVIFKERLTFTYQTLTDVNENKEYGSFTGSTVDDRPPTLCKVLDKECHSISEWKALIKPYMEE